MNLRCWWKGHRWASYSVIWSTPEGDPQCYTNDRCIRCGAPRNEYIFSAHLAIIRSHKDARVRGDWLELAECRRRA